jgi:hypothetical protein
LIKAKGAKSSLRRTNFYHSLHPKVKREVSDSIHVDLTIPRQRANGNSFATSSTAFACQDVIDNGLSDSIGQFIGGGTKVTILIKFLEDLTNHPSIIGDISFSENILHSVSMSSGDGVKPSSASCASAAESQSRGER